MPRPRKTSAPAKDAESYRYPEADLPARPEIGAQPHFKKTRPAATYRFDSSLAPELQWDGQNPARETAEALIAELTDHALRIAESAGQPASPERDRELANRKSQIVNLQSRPRKISGPFLNWSGTTSAPFPAGKHGQIAVKVIHPHGNELVVVKKLEAAK